MDIYKNYGFYGKTQIICAAIRTPKQIVDCAVAGADIVTTGLAVYQDAMQARLHPPGHLRRSSMHGTTP